MKTVISIALVFLLLFCLTIPTFAHSGRTDSNGGHYDHSTGKYHYHHGYSAHQHPNGVCPYDYDVSSNTSSSNNSEDKPGFAGFLGSAIIFALVAGAIYMFGFWTNDNYDDITKKTIKIIIIVVWAIVTIIFGINVCF